MFAYLICENFLSTCNIFYKKNKDYYVFKIDKVWRKDPEGCYSYLWSDTCSFIQQINFNSVVSVIEWLDDTYRIHYHYRKKTTDFNKNDFAAEPVEVLTEYHLSTF